ncbi:hypothetical protein BGZ83_007703 [Gryganskiella cystojenkinii]|nr:hypothetical protein BGZ83_007703 [Gryganskiella cystojenkinii]
MSGTDEQRPVSHELPAKPAIGQPGHSKATTTRGQRTYWSHHPQEQQQRQQPQPQRQQQQQQRQQQQDLQQQTSHGYHRQRQALLQTSHQQAQSSPPHHPPPQQQQQQNAYIFSGQAAVPSLDMNLSAAQHNQQQQQHNRQHNASTSPVAIQSQYLQPSCSPEMPIKASPVEQQLSWASWEETGTSQEDSYNTPAHTNNSYDDSTRDDVAEFTGTKALKVFTSSKKDDDGEFRKGQQFYLNVHLNAEDRERYRFLRIPTENIVLPCRADSTGKISLNASGKRGADSMSIPTSAQEDDVLALKLTTFLEPEHRVVVPCGRCKDKTPEILRFHPGVNGKPMIDENGMVTLRDGQVKLIASAWCASTSHHRGPGTKFSFQVELTSHSRAEPLLIYEGRSDEVEIYASHGRDKSSRIANKNMEKASKSHSPGFHDRGNTGPPSPAKTNSSSPPSSPTSASGHYENGSVKKRRENEPMTPPLVDSDAPPTIKSLEPRKGPICRENHVIIIGSNFTRGMTPMFGREYGTVVDINPFYIECTTPRYPITEVVQLWIYHNESYIPTDKTYEFTDEQAQSDMEQLLRNLIQSDGEGGDSGSYLSLLERIAGLPPTTDISGQSQGNGSTMLHNSVMLGYQAAVNMLIEEGIELDVEDDSGLTALDYAIFANKVEIAEILLQAGAMVSYRRLGSLSLSPSSQMLDLMRNLCGVDLASDLSQLGQAEKDNEDENDDELEEEDITLEDRLSNAFEATDLSEVSSSTVAFSSSAPSFSASQPRPVPQRNLRPLSISTVSTQSTGMMSLAPTMSTLAPSASSSTQSRPSIPIMGGRAAVHVVKGGQENIWQCAKKGNLALVKYHLDKEPSLINTPWKFDGRSVLSSACASSQPQELVEFLVQRGAQVNSADSFYKRTALHTLCEEGGLSQDDWRIVISQADQEANDHDVLAAMRFLLDNGAAVDAKNHWKETALMRLFAGRDCPLMVQELYSRGADSRLKSSKDAYPHGTALCYAAYYGRTQSLKWMVENDLLLNDEANIKDAIRWAKASKGEISSAIQSPSSQSLSLVKKEERKAEAIRLLESWLGESGVMKRRTLAKEMATLESEEWWQRMSGIMTEKSATSPPVTHLEPSSSSIASFSLSPSQSTSSFSSSSKMPVEMRPLWREVRGLSESLTSSSDLATSPSSRMKWNPLTMLRK